MKTPSDKEIVFTFMSEPSALRPLQWAARIAFPAGADDETLLPVTVTDGEGNGIESARLELAGRCMEVRAGRASMKYSDFVNGKHSTAVWLYRKGSPPVPGLLTFA